MNEVQDVASIRVEDPDCNEVYSTELVFTHEPKFTLYLSVQEWTP